MYGVTERNYWQEIDLQKIITERKRRRPKTGFRHQKDIFL